MLRDGASRLLRMTPPILNLVNSYPDKRPPRALPEKWTGHLRDVYRNPRASVRLDRGVVYVTAAVSRGMITVPPLDLSSADRSVVTLRGHLILNLCKPAGHPFQAGRNRGFWPAGPTRRP